jgi:hypothetical protein
MFTLRSFGVAATAWPASSTADDAPGPMTRAVPGRERNSYAVQSDAHRAHTTRHCTATPVHAAERRVAVACASPPTTAYSSRTPRALPRHSPSSDTVPTDTPPVQSPPHTTNTVPTSHHQYSPHPTPPWRPPPHLRPTVLPAAPTDDVAPAEQPQTRPRSSRTRLHWCRPRSCRNAAGAADGRGAEDRDSALVWLLGAASSADS